MPIGPMGHVYDWQAVDAYCSESPRPVFAAAAPPQVRGSGAGKIALLHHLVVSIVGTFPVHRQEIGDCVSFGWATAIDVLKCTEIAAGEAEEFRGVTATEPIYALSRVEVGGGSLGNSDGSVGAWAAKAVRSYGTLVRQRYDGIDLTNYSGARAKDWGRKGRGLPNELEPIAREHPVQTASLVTSYEDARDALFNGYPVPVCSNQGFQDVRDSAGFAKPSGTWSHCMCFIAMDDQSSRPGLLCMNSWGMNWITGPMRHNQPAGSFWVDASVADKMLSRNPDSYAISGYKGFPSQEIPQWI